MTRFKAASIHFLISLLIIGSFLAFAYFIWYGKIYLDISGVMVPAKVLIGVDVILGPLFTLIIFKHGKNHLKIDLMIIAFVQLLAFSYGAYTLYLGKPALVVLKGDIMEVVTQKNIEPGLNKDVSDQLGIFASPQYVAVDPNKVNIYQSVQKQQAFLTPINFNQDWVKANQVPVKRVIFELGLTDKKIKDKVGTEDLFEYSFYLMHDTFLNASLVVRDNLPYKIIHTSKDI